MPKPAVTPEEARDLAAFVLDAPDGSTWQFGDPLAAATVVRGSALDLCTVAGQRATAAETSLTGASRARLIIVWVRR